MNPRSKKYHESRKAQKGNHKGSSTKAVSDEQNEKTPKELNQNPVPAKSQDQPKEDVKAEQDDTAGPNNSGERSDEN